MGHLSCVVVFADDAVVEAEDDAFADGLALAAWATAVPPPTSAPVTIRAIAAFLIWCRMSFTSLPVMCHREPVKWWRPGTVRGTTEKALGVSEPRARARASKARRVP